MKFTKSMLETIRKMTGCTYFVLNSAEGLLGGFKDMESARQCQQEWQDRYDHDKLNKGMIVRIEQITGD